MSALLILTEHPRVAKAMVEMDRGLAGLPPGPSNMQQVWVLSWGTDPAQRIICLQAPLLTEHHAAKEVSREALVQSDLAQGGLAKHVEQGLRRGGVPAEAVVSRQDDPDHHAVQFRADWWEVAL